MTLKTNTKSKNKKVPDEMTLEQVYGQGVLFPGRRHGVHGGVRAGAGRHRTTPVGARPQTFRVTDEEAAAIRTLLSSMRSKDEG